MTCSGYIAFFSRVVTDQKCHDTFPQNGKDYIQVFLHQMKAYD